MSTRDPVLYPHAVWVHLDGSTRRLWQRYADAADARSVQRQLRRHGMDARIVNGVDLADAGNAIAHAEVDPR